jgi:probable rRNA maturation factor
MPAASRGSCGRPRAGRSAWRAVIEVEVLGARALGAGLPEAEVRELCRATAASRGIEAGHVAVHFVEAARIAELNARHRGREGATDVLSFPIDGPEAGRRPADGPPAELGDVFVCPEHTADLREAIIHGVLHLTGMDHETDDGAMLALQATLLAAAAARGPRSGRAP